MASMTPVELIKKIAAGERNFAMPMTLVLADGQRIECEQILRLLPGKRLVLRVKINDQTHILKLFTASAARSSQRERDNLAALANTSIPHAKLLSHIFFADGSALHCYQYIESAHSPAFSDNKLIVETGHLLCQLLQAGWVQTDPHPDNFLSNSDGIWLVDAGSLNQCSIDKKIIIQSFGLWAAQFPLWQQVAIARDLVAHWNDIPSNSIKITEAIVIAASKKAWKKRRKAYLKKISRACSEVDVGKTATDIWKLRREFDGSQLREFLREPELIITQGKQIKSGGATHIVRTMLDGREVIIKRYNYRNAWQGIKSLLGLGRARHNWWASHALRFCDIATPTPVAMLETRQGLRTTGYIVTLVVPGVEYWHAFDVTPPTEHEMMLPVILLRELAACRIEHGDLKAKNLLLDDKKLWLIDLDALRCDHWAWPLRYARDTQRFLRNWANQPLLHEQFIRAIDQNVFDESKKSS